MKERHVFTCTACGAQSPQWRGQCPRCKEWNTLEQRAAPAVRPRGAGPGAVRGAVSLQGLDNLPHTSLSTGEPALDEFLGGGIAGGGSVLLGGAPGIGKSTLLLQLAGAQAAQGRRCVYLSGEESLPQLRARAERLGLLHPELLALSSTAVEDGLRLLEAGDLALLIVDSVQTVHSARAEGLPGSVSQVRAVATELVEAARNAGCALILVGHVTKDGQIAGPKLLEHMVDTVLYLEGDRQQAFRLLRVLKNRFGPCLDVLVFSMGGRGMELVHDPSTLFLGARNPELSGTALALAVDGQRPFVVEVQALACRSYLSIPRRTALGVDANRLHLLLAVLEKRLHVDLGQLDIYAKLAGGLRLQDPGMDLALAAAILSSFYDCPLPERAVFWGEVDLNGQVRPAGGQDVRMNQAQRLGYGPIFHPEPEQGGVDTLLGLQQALFGKG